MMPMCRHCLSHVPFLGLPNGFRLPSEKKVLEALALVLESLVEDINTWQCCYSQGYREARYPMPAIREVVEFIEYSIDGDMAIAIWREPCVLVKSWINYLSREA